LRNARIASQQIRVEPNLGKMLYLAMLEYPRKNSWIRLEEDDFQNLISSPLPVDTSVVKFYTDLMSSFYVKLLKAKQEVDHRAEI